MKEPAGGDGTRNDIGSEWESKAAGPLCRASKKHHSPSFLKCAILFHFTEVASSPLEEGVDLHNYFLFLTSVPEADSTSVPKTPEQSRRAHRGALVARKPERTSRV